MHYALECAVQRNFPVFLKQHWGPEKSSQFPMFGCMTALHVAARFGDSEMVTLLHKYGCDIM